MADFWEGQIILFDGIIESTLLYGAAVLGLTYLDLLEQTQLEFF